MVSGPRKNCEIKIPNSELTYKVEQVSGHVLDYMKQIAEKAAESKIRDAVITVPAYFSCNQKEATE